ncbi:MAG: hypothetical protein JWM67_1344 [Mycobacterium sp.]|nr:hypothetical protein [Mycobacterium sp.]
MGRRGGWVHTLAGQIQLGVLGILVVTVVLGGTLYVSLSGRTLDAQYEQRALAVANSVAVMPEVQQVLARGGDPGGALQGLAARVISATGASYVVITDATGVRFSHPRPALIGQRLEEPVAALDGRDHAGIDRGSLGRSANGRAPVRGPGGAVIGQVSVGILANQVLTEQHHEIVATAAYSLLVLALGVVASWGLARRFKRVTFGLELPEIASLLQEREAMLHGIREGVVGLDRRGRVSLLNAEAERLLGIPPGATGRRFTELLPPGRLRDLIAGAGPVVDELVLSDDSLLTVNCRPVQVGGRFVGSVATLHDRTEMEAMVRELRSLHGLTAALRAQEHEFANRLHVMAGLLEMGDEAEASSYLAELSAGPMGRADDIRSRIGPPSVAALLLAKVTVAAEKNVTVTVRPDSRFAQPAAQAATLLTILGNLLDNSIDALEGYAGERHIEVYLDDRDDVLVQVRDSGPGLAVTDTSQVFVDGYSTKPQRGEMRRGLGLALVHRLVRRAGGDITVDTAGGTTFTVRMPAGSPAELSPELAR